MNAMSQLPEVVSVVKASEQPPAYNARDLTNEGSLASIVLDGQIYVLRITRAGKLILTK